VEDVSMVALLARLAISLAVVFGLMWVAARILRKRGLGNTKGATATSRIEVLARQGLGRTSSVQLVRVGGRTLVLGVTDTQVSVLGEADPLLLEAELALAALPAASVEPVESASGTKPGSWGPFLELLRERTVRSS
jgi:flagellar protein FliO/FliZ